jgi:hypothetical protein
MPLSKEKNRERMRLQPKTGKYETYTANGAAVTVYIDVPFTRDGWKDVKAYVERESSGMPNLERLQRIAGSLGASEVMFGVTGITMADIGSVVGVEAAKFEK